MARRIRVLGDSTVRHSEVVIALLCSGFIVAGIWSYGTFRLENASGLDDCSAVNDSSEGRTLMVSLAQVRAVSASGFELSYFGRPLQLTTDAAPPARGETVSVKTICRNGVWVESNRLKHPLRWVKALWGVVGLGILLPFVSGACRFARGWNA